MIQFDTSLLSVATCFEEVRATTARSIDQSPLKSPTMKAGSSGRVTVLPKIRFTAARTSSAEGSGLGFHCGFPCSDAGTAVCVVVGMGFSEKVACTGLLVQPRLAASNAAQIRAHRILGVMTRFLKKRRA